MMFVLLAVPSSQFVNHCSFYQLKMELTIVNKKVQVSDTTGDAMKNKSWLHKKSSIKKDQDINFRRV